MLDLMVLAFQTDSTRIATYQLASMHGAISVAATFPQLLGYAKNMHALAHGANKPGGTKNNGQWQAFLASRLNDFLTKLDAIEEGEGTLLDNTLIYYGSSNSNTHNNRNYPLVLAGAKNMGFNHGQFLRFKESTPLSNLYSTMLDRLGTPDTSFADSNGSINEILG